jgi:uncharacterized membrane protein
MLKGTIWNLFLAVIPVVLGYATAWGLKKNGKQSQLPRAITVPMFIAWLLFLPNTCYLLTEWRHLLFDARWAGLLDTAHEDRNAMLSVAKWGLFFAAYSSCGILSLALSIRPMERWLASTKTIPPFILAPPFFFLMSLGVYLGLLPRLNSWDIFTRPLQVWAIAWSGLTHIELLSAIVLFALLLWGVYEAVDLWADGISARMRKWGFLPARKEDA